MNNIPATPREWQRQIEKYEWMKRTYPDLYVDVVRLVEERPERAR